jgi:MFS family permease
VQGVLGGTATNSGLVLLPMMLGSVVTATAGGFLMNKISYRAIMIPSSIVLVLGTVLISTLSADSSRFIVTLYMIVVGLGIGATFSVLGNSAIHAFDARQRGSASATLNFLRSLGMTVGITVFGIVQSHAFAGKLSSLFPGSSPIPGGLQSGDPHALLDPARRMQIPKQVLEQITGILSSSVVHTFAWTIVPAVLALVFAVAMSKEKLDPATHGAPSSAASH